MISVHISGEPFRAWLRNAEQKLRAGARQALGQSVNLALAHARSTQAFKDQTGALRRSIVRFEKATFQMGIKATAKHAAYVEYGTKPHRIEARRARTLRFVQNGEIRFRRSVQHPGTKPTHFMQQAGEVGQRALQEMLAKAIASSMS